MRKYVRVFVQIVQLTSGLTHCLIATRFPCDAPCHRGVISLPQRHHNSLLAVLFTRDFLCTTFPGFPFARFRPSRNDQTGVAPALLPNVTSFRGSQFFWAKALASFQALARVFSLRNPTKVFFKSVEKPSTLALYTL